MTMFGNAQGLSPGNLGMTLFKPSAAGAPALWYNPLNSAAITARIIAGGLWAWRAQANDSVTWGPGPANYAASLIDEAQGVVLVEGNGAVPWAAATGWGFVQAAAKYLDTTIVPVLDQTWFALIQYTGYALTNNTSPFGLYDTVGHNAAFGIRRVNTLLGMLSWHGSNALSATNAPAQTDGNYGFGARQPYRNGVAEAVLIGVSAATTDLSVYIGALNFNTAAIQLPTANIQAFLLCDDVTAFTPADITAIAALPAGSMHNL